MNESTSRKLMESGQMAIDLIQQLKQASDNGECLKAADILNQIQKLKEGLMEKAEKHTEASTNGWFIYTRIRDVKRPGKAHPTDAGIDFYIPEAKAWDDGFRTTVIEMSKNPVVEGSPAPIWFCNENGTDCIKVMPNAHVAIPSGIKSIFPRDYGMMFVNKSGISTKLKLDHSACLVDSEYRGEIIMCFFNHSTEPVVLTPGMKITQGLIVPIINLKMEEVLNSVYDDLGSSTDRGGGFGSSGV